MKGPNVDLGKAVLYGVSGGFLTALFGTLGAGMAQAAPPPALVKPSDKTVHNAVANAVKTPAPVSRPTSSPTPSPAKDKGSARDKGSAKDNGDDKGKGSHKDPRVDGRVSSDDGPRNANNGVKQPEKPKVFGPPATPAATKVPVLDKKSADRFNRVVRQTLPGALPPLPKNAGGGGVAVSDQAGDARRTKVGGVAVSDHTKAGGGAVSDQLGSGRRAAEKVARNEKQVKLEAKLRAEKAKKAAKRDAERLASEKQKKANERPIKSVGVCGNLSATGGILSTGLGGCVVADSKGVGLTGSTRGGPEVGAGGHAGVGVQVSSADIDALEGLSANVGGSAVAGVGLEGSGGVSLDGKNNVTYYGGAAAGAEGSGGGNLEYTKVIRLFDWPGWLTPGEEKDLHSERRFGR
ncbi:hypothetical protein [Amycolatopsis sp. NPDC059657]|uniref:hypothetical protein n=1 Tax=Amycolatopsis sp. NPDC059657 TaxID=3346899 RepID=UPI00366D709D